MFVASPSGARAYAGFVVHHRRLLAFGVFTAVLSGFGQTFYIGLFNGELRAAFALSHGELGLAYGAATLGSAMVVAYAGRLYDRADLRLYLGAAAILLALGCVLLAGARGLTGLVLALLLLRLGGQGLMGHIAMTTMARRFHAGRGKAVSVAGLGFPLAEAAFPAAAVAALTLLPWRGLWAVSAAVVLALCLPLLLWLLRGERAGEEPIAHQHDRGRDWTLREVRRDWRFPLLAPATLAAPFVVTVAFFHQVPMAHAKGWSMELVASGLSLFAVGHVSGLLGGGLLVDRWSAARVFVPALLPMVASMAALAALDVWWAALLWPGLLGLGLGLSAAAVSALLAELYGITHLGAIRALLHSLMIASTAVGPPLLGWLLDLGIGTEALALGIGVGIAAAALAAAAAIRAYGPATA